MNPDSEILELRSILSKWEEVLRTRFVDSDPVRFGLLTHSLADALFDEKMRADLLKDMDTDVLQTILDLAAYGGACLHQAHAERESARRKGIQN